MDSRVITGPGDVDDLFDILAKEDRRRVLRYLRDTEEEEVGVDELLSEVTEGAREAEKQRQIFPHADGAKLDDGGLVDYDPDRGTVSYAATGEVDEILGEILTMTAPVDGYSHD